MCLGFDAVKSFFFFFVETRTVVWRTDHVESVCVEGCDGSKLDVCPVSWMKNEDDENENDVVRRMVVTVEEKLESEACDWMLVHLCHLGSWVVV